MTMNMENRKTVTVAPTAYPGYPSFSRLDDKIIFATISGRDTVVSVVKLKDDKQTPAVEPSVAIRKMKWPIYFATGIRNLDPTRKQPEMAKRTAKPDLKVLPWKGGLKATIVGAAQTQVRLSIIRADGKIVHQKKLIVTGESVPYLWNRKSTAGSGVYFIRMETPQGSVVKKMTSF